MHRPLFSESSAIKWKQAGKTFALPVPLDASRVHNIFFCWQILQLVHNVWKTCIQESPLFLRSRPLVMLPTSFLLKSEQALPAREEGKIQKYTTPLSVTKHMRHTTLTAFAFDNIYNKIPKRYHSVRAFCRCSMSATPISWAMTLAGMVRLVTEHHIATMPYSPHCHITSLPHPPTCYVRAV